MAGADNIPKLDIPSESGMAIPGIPAGAGRAEEILAQHSLRMQSKTFKEALLLRRFVKSVVSTRDALRKGVQYRFIGPVSAKEFMNELERVITPEIQDELQETLLKQNPSLPLPLGTMAESLIRKGGTLEIKSICKTLEEGNPTSTVDLYRICNECGQQKRDVVLMHNGKQPKCPLVPGIHDIFGDVRDLEGPNYFIEVPLLDRDWYERQGADIINVINEWRGMDRSWHTQQKKLEEEERWRHKNPIGMLITKYIHTPTRKVMDKYLKILESQR